MLKGFFDDSGSDGERPPFVLAGYVLQAEQWAAFADDWKVELDREPRLEFFHMADAAYGDGPFRGMQEPFRKCKVRDMLGVIQRHHAEGIYNWLRWEDYRSIVQPLVIGPLKNPYPLLYFVMWDTILAYEKHKGIFPEPMELCFDEQGEVGEFARMFYLPSKEQMPPDIQQMFGSTPDIKDDELVVPLQAADMLAWSLRRQNDPEFIGKDEWQWLHDELHKTIFLGHRCTEATLRGVAELTKIGMERAERLWQMITGRV